MPTKIIIKIKDITLKAELFDSECAKAILNILPIEARPNEWGDEFYFTIPVEYSLDETATTDVKAGDIGYWPPGSALAIFFGPTPLSSDSKPVPASKVNILGRITDDPKILKKAKGAEIIQITKK
ncbi:MAG: cyclophilin-like fold protein [Syntrophorhabdaceae bacterium]|nr:cyclophilin-like fold protein [Syntrophorhabdaceae bacterium]